MCLGVEAKSSFGAWEGPGFLSRGPDIAPVTSFHCRFSWGPRQPPESQVFSVVLHVSKHPQLMVSVQKLEKFCCSQWELSRR